MFDVFASTDAQENTEDGGVIAQDKVGVNRRKVGFEDLGEDLTQLLAVIGGEVGLEVLHGHKICLLICFQIRNDLYP